MGQDLMGPSGQAGTDGSKHHYNHDQEQGASLSTTIVTAIADVQDEDPTSLGFALHDYFDTDALDSLFAPKLDGTAREGGRLTFTVPGHTVTVTSDGHIVITEIQEPSFN